MIVILGLIILVAAVVVGVAGVLTNADSAHALTHGFAVFGYHLTGSTGTLFLSGIVVGAAGMLGLGLLLAGARRTSRRGSAARAGLKQSRGERAAAGTGRDDLTEHQATPAPTPVPNPIPATSPSQTAAAADSSEGDRRGVPDGHRRWLHPFGHRPAPH